MAIDKNKIAAPVAITDPYNLLGIYPANGVWAVSYTHLTLPTN